MKKIRLSLISTIFPPTLGGPSSYVHDLALYLQGEVKLTVYVPNHSNVISGPDLVFRTYARYYKIKFVSILVNEIRLAWIIIKSFFFFDLIYAHGSDVAFGLVTLLPFRHGKKKSILKFTGYTPWERVATIENKPFESLEDFVMKSFFQVMTEYGLLFSVYNWLSKRAYQKAGKIITPSLYLQSVLENMQIPKSRIAVIRNFPPLLKIAHNRCLENKEKKIKLITACRLVPTKGLEELVRWVGGEEHATLDIIGDGPSLFHLNKILRDFKFNNVNLFPAMSRLSLVDRIYAADLFVLNSLYEGCSHTLLECVAVGTPFVATQIPGIQELLALLENQGGILFHPHQEFAFWRAVGEAFSLSADSLLRAQSLLASEFSQTKSLKETLRVLSEHFKGIQNP